MSNVIYVEPTGIALMDLIQHDDDDYRWNQLQRAKERIVGLLHQDKATRFAIVETINSIAEQELYRLERDADGNPFASMDEYFPHLIGELSSTGQIDSFERRTFFNYQAMYRVFVLNNLATTQEIVEIGPGHFQKLLAAADYNRVTGELAAEPRDKKLGKARIEALVEELRDNHAAGVETRVTDTRTLVDEERGVKQRDVRMEWRPVAGGRYKLVRFTAEIEYEYFDILNGGLPAEEAKKLARKLGAVSKGLPDD